MCRPAIASSPQWRARSKNNREVLAEREAAIQSSQVKLDHDRDGIAAREQAWQKDQASLAAEREAFHTERETLQSEREAIHAERESLDAERDALSEKLDSLTTASQSTGDELKSQLASVEGQLKAERAAWDKRAWQCRRAAASAGEGTRRADGGAGGREHETGIGTRASGRGRRTGRAAAEVRSGARGRATTARPRRRTGTRACQPAGPRPNRLGRIGPLAGRARRAWPSESPNWNSDRRLRSTPTRLKEPADLQRRFELAVEDVRDLKKQISQLEAQLAAAKSRAPSAVLGRWRRR